MSDGVAVMQATRACGAAGEMLHVAEPFLEKNVHPTVIVRGYVKALEDAIQIIDDLSFPLDVNNRDQMLKIVNSCLGTKFTNRFGDLMAVSLVSTCSSSSHGALAANAAYTCVSLRHVLSPVSITNCSYKVHHHSSLRSGICLVIKSMKPPLTFRGLSSTSQHFRGLH